MHVFLTGAGSFIEGLLTGVINKISKLQVLILRM